MAILEPIEKESANNNSIKKTIDIGAMDIVTDILQKHQYQYPIKSTVREIASNCLDAIKEKNIAITILTGKAKEEDYFINRPEYPDSNFKPGYYNLKYLSPEGENDNVVITYTDGHLDRDTISFEENGVGLWDQRLLGYFNLGFSTKRNWARGIGKWGLGAKSPLSTNILSFRIVTRYNGLEAEFDIYDNDVNPVVPKFNLETGETNVEVNIPILDKDKKQVIDEEGNGKFFKFYARKTEKYNGTCTIIPVKKHVKQEYLSAVRGQLMYFDNISLAISDATVTSAEILKSPIIYETEDFVISDNNIYTRPHLVIGGINYNDIDFDELEIEQRRGNIGIKVNAEDVDITPSRESVVWNAKTRATVLRVMNSVRDAAMELILKQFGDEGDYLSWLLKVQAFRKNVSAQQDTDLVVISRLSNIVDLKENELPFKIEGLNYSANISEALPGFDVRKFKKIWDGSKIVIQKEKCKYLHEIDFNNLYFKPVKSNPKINLSIIKSNEESSMPAHFFVLEPSGISSDVEFSIENYNPRFRPQLEAILSSSLIKDYRVVKELELEEEEEEIEEKEVLTLAQDRALNSEILVHDVCFNSSPGYFTGDVHTSWVSKATTSIKTKEIKAYTGLILYCYGDTEDMTLLANIGRVLSMNFSRRIVLDNYYNTFKTVDTAGYNSFSAEGQYYNMLSDPELEDSYMTVMVSKENSKHLVHNGIYVKDFLLQFKDKHLTMSHYLVQWNTARHVQRKLVERFKFLSSLRHLNKEIADIADELRDYACQYYTHSPLQSKFEDEFVKHTDTLLELQLFISRNADQPEAIAAKSMELFGAEATNASAVDIDIYQKMELLIEMLAPVEIMFNDSKSLVDDSISNNLIDEYIKYCKVVGFKVSLD